MGIAVGLLGAPTASASLTDYFGSTQQKVIVTITIVSRHGRHGLAFFYWRKPDYGSSCHGNDDLGSGFGWENSPKPYPLSSDKQFPVHPSRYDVVRFALRDGGKRAKGEVKVQWGCQKKWLPFSIPKVHRQPVLDGRWRARKGDLQFTVVDHGRLMSLLTGSYRTPPCSRNDQPGSPRDIAGQADPIGPTGAFFEDPYSGASLFGIFDTAGAGRVTWGEKNLNATGEPTCPGGSQWDVARVSG
jgi:hypothetical protein